MLLVGGLGAGYFLFAGGGGAADEQAEEEAVEQAPMPAIYHPLSPAFVVNLPPGGKVRLLKAEVQVMSRSQELIDFITENDPMVRHNLLDLFGSVNSDTIASRAGKEQLQADVKKRLEKVTEEYEGSGEIEGVFFTAFVTQ
ncbi:MAG: hypothetical protein B0D88_00410 [Candidatus Sedimenticola endophacoides]|nr:MAG: hypothetical protein B0D88_00410 [Candidatus Sedimenticola endophacoides]